jgi:hypothetical protein
MLPARDTSSKKSGFFPACRFPSKPKTSRHRRVSTSPHPFRCLHAMAESSMEDISHPEDDVECLEDYVPGGYHPTLIAGTFCSGRYTVVHKLGFGGYSTIWLAWDQQHRRYVSLKILTARASIESQEGEVLNHLMKSDLTHVGERSFRRSLTNPCFMVQTDIILVWSENLLALVLLSPRRTAQI